MLKWSFRGAGRMTNFFPFPDFFVFRHFENPKP